MGSVVLAGTLARRDETFGSALAIVTFMPLPRGK
jgi:hypothetical protein